MKHIIFTLFSLFFAIHLFAQSEQQGFVKEYNENSKKKPIAGVELLISNANHDVSRSDGHFHLKFRTLKPGDPVKVQQIYKAGYEIFNKEQLDVWRIANNGEPFTIVLCKSSKFKALKDKYNAISYKSYNDQLNIELNKLEELLKEGKIKEEQYETQKLQICQYYDQKLDNLDSYIDRFARIDLSEVTRDEKRIVELVAKGKIQEAIDIYNTLRLDEKLINNYLEYQRADSAIDKLSQISEEKRLNEEKLLSTLKNKFDLMRMQGSRQAIDTILNVYEKIAEQCTGSYRIIQSYVDFADEERHANAVAKWGRILLDLLPDNPSLKYKYYRKVAQAEGVLGNLDYAQLYRNRAIEIIVTSFEQNSFESAKAFFSVKIDEILEKVVDKNETVLAFHDLEKIESYADSIFNKDSDDMLYTYYDCKNYLYDVKNEIHLRIQDLDEAANDILTAASYADSLVSLSNSYDAKITLAHSYNQLGYITILMQDYDKSENYLKIAKQILDEIYPDNPYKYYAFLMSNYTFLGLNRFYSGDIEKSKSIFQEGIKIAEEIIEARPYPLYFTTFSEMINNLGYINFVNEDYDSAEIIYKRAIEISRPFAQRNPSAHLSALCIPQINLGMLKLKQNKLDEFIIIQDDYWKNMEKAYSWFGTTVLSNYAVAWDNKGYYELLKGNDSSALEIWKKIETMQNNYLDINPTSLLYNGLKEIGLLK